MPFSGAGVEGGAATTFGRQGPNPSRLPYPLYKEASSQFLGLTGCYQWFILNFSTLTAPLTDLVKDAAPKNVQWTKGYDEAFRTQQDWLSWEPVLFHSEFPNPLFIKQKSLMLDSEQCYPRNLGEKNTLFSILAGSCFCGEVA